jgi:hypothetical protein
VYMNNFEQQVLARGMPRFGLPRIVYISSFEQQPLCYPGSMLKAKSRGFWPDHFGIFEGASPDGTLIVLHSTEEGVVRTSLEEFALERGVEVVKVPCTFEHRRAILDRASSQIGHPYNVLLANCEHFANWAFFGVPDSPQLRTYAVGTGLAGAALYALIRLGEDRGPRPARRRKARG